MVLTISSTAGIESLLAGIPVFALLSLDLADIVLLIICSVVYGLIFLYATYKLDIWGESELKLFNSFWSLKNR